MKPIMLAILFTSMVGCNSGMQEVHKTDACQSYYDFIHKQWMKKEGYYQFKVKPEYLEGTQEAREIREKYFNEPCLVGLPKRVVLKMFGTPNKEEFLNGEPAHLFYTYCLNAQCNEMFNMLIKDDKVATAYPNPSELIQSH